MLTLRPSFINFNSYSIFRMDNAFNNELQVFIFFMGHYSVFAEKYGQYDFFFQSSKFLTCAKTIIKICFVGVIQMFLVVLSLNVHGV